MIFNAKVSELADELQDALFDLPRTAQRKLIQQEIDKIIRRMIPKKYIEKIRKFLQSLNEQDDLSYEKKHFQTINDTKKEQNEHSTKKDISHQSLSNQSLPPLITTMSINDICHQIEEEIPLSRSVLYYLIRVEIERLQRKLINDQDRQRVRFLFQKNFHLDQQKATKHIHNKVNELNSKDHESNTTRFLNSLESERKSIQIHANIGRDFSLQTPRLEDLDALQLCEDWKHEFPALPKRVLYFLITQELKKLRSA